MQEVQEEGKYAIDSPGNPAMADVPPEEYTLGTYFVYLHLSMYLKKKDKYF